MTALSELCYSVLGQLCMSYINLPLIAGEGEVYPLLAHCLKYKKGLPSVSYILYMFVCNSQSLKLMEKHGGIAMLVDFFLTADVCTDVCITPYT